VAGIIIICQLNAFLKSLANCFADSTDGALFSIALTQAFQKSKISDIQIIIQTTSTNMLMLSVEGSDILF
jgi:hypothetical protein